MLLCEFCLSQWREWIRDSSKYYEKIGDRAHRGQRCSTDLERYELLPTARWCQAYWRNKFATENGRVPLPGRQVPSCAEARQASATPQSLR
jgi:hypothetical protein